jgi:hypothetical protein
MGIQLSDRQRDILVLILMAGGFLLIVVVGVFIAVIVSQSSNRGSSTGRDIRTAVYNLEKREIPTRATSPNTLFPQTFGTFTRKSATGTLRGQVAGTFQALYARDKDTVDIIGARDNNYAQAEADMKRAAAQYGPTNQIISIDATLSYVLITSPTEVRLIYSHANWYWNIKASSQAVLDDFMKVFPY